MEESRHTYRPEWDDEFPAMATVRSISWGKRMRGFSERTVYTLPRLLICPRFAEGKDSVHNGRYLCSYLSVRISGILLGITIGGVQYNLLPYFLELKYLAARCTKFKALEKPTKETNYVVSVLGVRLRFWYSSHLSNSPLSESTALKVPGVSRDTPFLCLAFYFCSDNTGFLSYFPPINCRLKAPLFD
jgi:hypothetical protein